MLWVRAAAPHRTVFSKSRARTSAQLNLEIVGGTPCPNPRGWRWRPAPPQTWVPVPVRSRPGQLLFHRLAHFEFLGLAGDRHRDLGDEADVARHLEVGDAVFAEDPDVVFGCSVVVAQLDPGA